MKEISWQPFLFILVFCVFVPSVDQITDILMVNRLLTGPDENNHIKSGKISTYWNNHAVQKSVANDFLFKLVLFFPTKQLIDGKFSDLSDMKRSLYFKVDHL